MDNFENRKDGLGGEPGQSETDGSEARHDTLVNWTEFVAALDEIYAVRQRQVTPFDTEVAASVFRACSNALADGQKSEAIWRAVSAPTGGGKTTAAFAFAVAMVRAGGSVLFLANTRRECDEAFLALQPLLGGKVAIRTTDHDQDELDQQGSKYVEEIKARGNYTPAAFFHRSRLGDYPALIGTHSGYKKNPGELLNLANGVRRKLIMVDERPDDIDIADFTLADFERIHEACRAKGLDEFGEEPALTRAFGEAWRQLTSAQFVLDRSQPFQELRISLDVELLDALKRLAKNHKDRASYVRGTRIDSEELRLAARLVILAQETHGFAFAALHTEFSHGTRLVAYAPNWPQAPGTVLLDATSDIDGYRELSDARVQEVVPEADYGKLEAIHLDGPQYLTAYTPKELWNKPSTRNPLLKWMKRCILENTKEGEPILVVSWKNVIDGGQLQLLDWQGRRVHFCHFGAGIGSNQWRDCEAVFIFGSYVKPKRTTVAETHGIKKTRFQSNDDAMVRGLKGDYLTTKVGLMLRWFKQLAMRGCARELDELGVAKPMRLYFSASEFKPLVDHWQRMFPGSPVPVNVFVDDDEGKPKGDTKPRRRKSMSEALLKLLAAATEHNSISSADILKATGIELKNVMRNRKEKRGFLDSCATLGWAYVPGRGRGQMSGFSRT
jgi:hypothetical protein